MNEMNDQRFFDLAMKVIANQATEAERTELDSIVARDPHSKAGSKASGQFHRGTNCPVRRGKVSLLTSSPPFKTVLYRPLPPK